MLRQSVVLTMVDEAMVINNRFVADFETTCAHKGTRFRLCHQMIFSQLGIGINADMPQITGISVDIFLVISEKT